MFHRIRAHSATQHPEAEIFAILRERLHARRTQKDLRPRDREPFPAGLSVELAPALAPSVRPTLYPLHSADPCIQGSNSSFVSSGRAPRRSTPGWRGLPRKELL